MVFIGWPATETWPVCCGLSAHCDHHTCAEVATGANAIDKIERRRAKAERYCRLCHRPLPHRKTAQSATRLPSLEIKACAPGAQLDDGPIAEVHRKETDPQNGFQIGQLN